MLLQGEGLPEQQSWLKTCWTCSVVDPVQQVVVREGDEQDEQQHRPAGRLSINITSEALPDPALGKLIGRSDRQVRQEHMVFDDVAGILGGRCMALASSSCNKCDCEAWVAGPGWRVVAFLMPVRHYGTGIAAAHTQRHRDGHLLMSKSRRLR